MMLVCIDTNVLLNAFARNSTFASIFDAITTGRLSIAVSTSILLEYEEISQQQGGPAFAGKIMRMIALVSTVHQTVHFAAPSFEFGTVPADADDNKFADCAIVTHADFVITQDRHFATLSNAGYKPQPISPEEFIRHHLGTL
jgi:putative PIN family toxin of toxin-antitoxin system